MQNAALGSAFIITDPARIVKQIAELAPQRKFGGKRRTGGIKCEGRNANVRRGMLEHATGDIRARGGKEYAAGGLETYSENEKRSGKKRSKACGGQQYAASGKTGGGLPVQAKKATAVAAGAGTTVFFIVRKRRSGKNDR